ncbi:MAG: CoA transferase [Chloroflexi bacterium]|nr:CoA transferase [Chloroflexota bacterium]
MSGPLDGIRVLDMGAFSVGPQACGLLGLLGAEVIRIEPDYGDGLMRITPYINGTGTTYLCAHHNSKSVILGLKNEADKELGYRLVEMVDVLVENRRVGALDRLGFGYDTLSRINPRLIYASSAAYGHSGPFLKYGGADNFIQAMSGFASLNGSPGGPPEWLRYIALVDGTGSIAIAQGCLIALAQRELTGRGQYIDLDEFSSCLFMESPQIAEYLATGREPRRMGSESPKICPSRAYRTQDGKYILVSALSAAHWVNLCSALEMKDLIGDERFGSNEGRLAHRDEVNRLIQEKIQDRPLAWWTWQLGRYGVPHSRAMTLPEVVTDPFLVSNEYVVERPSPWGPLKLQNAPWRFTETPLNPIEASPYMDSHRDYVLSLLGKKPFRAPRSGPAVPAARGIRVIDLTQGLAGPICTVELGGIGAEVIKVERDGGDFAREWGAKINGESAMFLQLNHDKKSVLIDYATPDGLAVLRDLVKTADVFIEDMKPGQAEALGLGYHDLRPLKKDLIYCSLYPFWDKGPGGLEDATELELQGLSGVLQWIGEPGKEPVRIGADVASVLTGMLSFAAIVAALYNKSKRRRGERIITSGLASLIYVLGHAFVPMSGVDYWTGFWATSPYDHAETGYRTKNRPIMFGTLTRDGAQAMSTFRQVCQAVGLEKALGDDEFVQKCYRTLGMGRDQQEHKHIFESAFRNWDSEELVALIDKFGGLAAPLLTFAELFHPLHDQIKANNMVVTQQHPRAGRISLVNYHWRHGEAPARIQTPAPAPGEHTAAVLASLGYSEDNIGKLEAAGIIRRA